MEHKLRIMCLHMLLLIIFICGCTKDTKTEKRFVELENKIEGRNDPSTKKSSSMPIEKLVVNDNPDCVEFVALWSSGDIAEKIDKDKKWVFLNYTVDLWDAPPTYSTGNIVGKLRASSYARIIAIMGDDYKVESPVSNAQGWISNEHVKTISKKNPKTRKLCE